MLSRIPEEVALAIQASNQQVILINYQQAITDGAQKAMLIKRQNH